MFIIIIVEANPFPCLFLARKVHDFSKIKIPGR